MYLMLRPLTHPLTLNPILKILRMMTLNTTRGEAVLSVHFSGSEISDLEIDTESSDDETKF